MATFTNQATLSYNNITVSSNVVSGEITETLTVSKTAVSDSYTQGEILTYAVSLVNSGTSDLTGITLTDDLGAYDFGATVLVPLTYVTGSVEYFRNGVLQPAPTAAGGPPLVISGISVPAQGSAVIIYQARANEFASPEAGADIVNTVTAGSAGAQASATVPAETLALLSISKSLSPLAVSENDQITYTFTVSNEGNTAENTAVINDTFDPVLSGITVAVDGTAALTTDYEYDETTGEFATTAGAFTVPAATVYQDPTTGAYTVTPGTAVITVTGTI